jgi:hypothetical protein
MSKMVKEYLHVLEDQIPCFITEFRANKTEMKREVQLRRSRITHSCRKAVMRFLRYKMVPKNASDYMDDSGLTNLQNKFAADCKSYWRKNWDCKA